MHRAGRHFAQAAGGKAGRGSGLSTLALLLSGLLVAAAGYAAGPAAPAWAAYAVRYATLTAFPLAGLVAGADTTRTLDIAAMFWVLRAPGGRCVLVDAGFHRQRYLDSWKPAGFVSPDQAVRRLGVLPQSVSDLIVTHVHWDHLDGADLFANARLWIQRAEYDYYVGPGGVPAHAGIDSVHAALLARLRSQGRLRFVEGDAREILPGITAFTGGKHTYASQYLGVRTAQGTVVLASDNVYLYENLDRHLPIAQTLDAASNLAAQGRMRRLATEERFIVPGHDPAVLERFPRVAPGVVRIE